MQTGSYPGVTYSFDYALYMLKVGAMLRRKAWAVGDGLAMWDKKIWKIFATAEILYQPTQEDLLANDWYAC